jgi:hypothetical protein
MKRTSSGNPKKETAPSTTIARGILEPDSQVQAEYRDTEEAGVTQARDNASEDNKHQVGKVMQPAEKGYTTYDIRCGGASRETFGVIKDRRQEDAYHNLLLRSRSVIQPLRLSEHITSIESRAVQRRRKLYAGATVLDDHWRWRD